MGKASGIIGGQIGCFVLVLAFNFWIGGVALNYALASIIGKTIHWLPAGLVGSVLGEITIPAALICWVVRLVGVHVPFVH